MEQRARDILGEYERKARRLDLQYHNVPQEDPRGGPILAALRAWPAPIGLVFGAFGEASESVEELAQAITTKRAAAEWKAMGARTEAEAKAFIIAQLRRRWGCAAVQERARLLIARVPQVGRPLLRQSIAAGARMSGASLDEVTSAAAFQSWR